MSDGFFYRFIKAKNVKSQRYKKALAGKICPHHIKYATVSMGEAGDKVVGRDCSCTFDDEYFRISDGGGTVIFKSPMTGVKLYELMSLDGAVISGKDETKNGEYTEMTVHYSYYR